jgi:hypothetical protein
VFFIPYRYLEIHVNYSSKYSSNPSSFSTQTYLPSTMPPPSVSSTDEYVEEDDEALSSPEHPPKLASLITSILTPNVY